jgi:hypothetical protein
MAKSNRVPTRVSDDAILTPRQAADLLELTEATLAQWRYTGNHPLSFIRLNHQVVRYRLGDIQRFLQSHTVRPQAKTREGV